MQVSYVSRRGKRVITREGDVEVDQFPGNERRFVIRRSNGKQLMLHLENPQVWQRRDNESKWTRVGRPTSVQGVIDDTCPNCGEVQGRLWLDGIELTESFKRDRPHRRGNCEWKFQCLGCNQTTTPDTTPSEPPYPEPEDCGWNSETLEQIREYADVVSEEVFDGELSTVSWSWNGNNSSVAGRHYVGKIELTPQYLETHGWNEVLKVVRHEMIHAWQTQIHGSGGHDAAFHDWMVPANTRRHCYSF
jgi:hypothetical protein